VKRQEILQDVVSCYASSINKSDLDIGHISMMLEDLDNEIEVLVEELLTLQIINPKQFEIEFAKILNHNYFSIDNSDLPAFIVDKETKTLH
jgi:hypothetical protein